MGQISFCPLIRYALSPPRPTPKEKVHFVGGRSTAKNSAIVLRGWRRKEKLV
jgi:hypothetical protein